MYRRAKHWMKYIVATTALLLSKNGPRSNLRLSNFQKFPGRASLQTPLVLRPCFLQMHTYTLDIDVNPPSNNPGYGPGTSHSILTTQAYRSRTWTASARKSWRRLSSVLLDITTRDFHQAIVTHVDYGGNIFAAPQPWGWRPYHAAHRTPAAG